MGGSIEVESTEGKGSSFIFDIPFDRVQTSEDSYGNLSFLAGHQLAIISSSEAAKKCLSHYFDSHGFAVPIFKGYHFFHQSTIEEKVDMLIVDERDEDADLLKWIEKRKIQVTGRPFYAILLSLRENQVEVKKISSPYDLFIKKPLLYRRLATKMNEFFKDRHSSKKNREQLKITSISDQYPLKILVAEDNPINQKMAKMFMMKLGYRCELVGNGLEAVGAVRRQKYDLIFMDIQMPEMDGYEATQVILDEFKDDDAPIIIAMTANALSTDREKCLTYGMKDYLSKPVRLEQIKETIEKWGYYLHNSVRNRHE